MRAGSIASHTWRWLELAASKRLVGQESGDFGLLFQGQSGTPERGIFATHTHTHTQHTQNNTTVLTPLILTRFATGSSGGAYWLSLQQPSSCVPNWGREGARRRRRPTKLQATDLSSLQSRSTAAIDARRLVVRPLPQLCLGSLIASAINHGRPSSSP